MAGINFKKLVLRQELPLIQSVVQMSDPATSIFTESGEWLLGKIENGHNRYPVVLDQQVLGYVLGNEKAEVTALLLTRLACREEEKRSLAQELLGKYKEISLLFNLSEKILGSSSVREAAVIVLQEAQHLLSAESGALFLRQEANGALEKIASFGPLSGQTLLESAVRDEGKIHNIAQPGCGEIFNGALGDTGDCIASADAPEAPVDSSICVPLKDKASSLGAIALSRPASNPYSAEDLKLTTTLAGQAAGVINALLHENKLKESRQNNLIYRLSSQIHDSLELDVILNTTVSEIYSALQLDRCVFLWARSASDLAAGDLEIAAEAKRPNLPSIQGHYPHSMVGELAYQFCQRDPVRINDIASISDLASRRFLQAQGFTALLAIPIQTRSGQIGAICCGTCCEPRTWVESEVTLLQTVTNQLAIALDQAELYDQSRTAAQIAQDKAQQLEVTIAELQQAQLQLVQSEKMSSIGQMVAGVAHEINNPISFIHGNLSHLQTYTKDLIHLIQSYRQEYNNPSETLQTDIEDIDLDFLLEDLPQVLKSMTVGTDRIREIVLSLRNFSRLDQANFKTVDIHEGINSTLLILGHRLKGTDAFPGVKIVKAYSDLPPIDCYPGQLNQVFMNILANGIDALEEANVSSPTLTIYTQKTDPNRIQIRVVDNGYGIPASVKENLFDPFFTTKEVGKGTGLGLSISYQIITEHHGGSIQCLSTLGQGTEFVIEIPIRQSSASPDQPA
ncbi:MAG: GAF domain-containing protein [Phormidesmis sp.]